MGIVKKIVLFFLVFGMLQGTVFSYEDVSRSFGDAEVVYVAPDGSDTNDGISKHSTQTSPANT